MRNYELRINLFRLFNQLDKFLLLFGSVFWNELEDVVEFGVAGVIPVSQNLGEQGDSVGEPEVWADVRLFLGGRIANREILIL